METYCVSCKKNISNKNFIAKRTKQNRSMIASNCAACHKNIKFY